MRNLLLLLRHLLPYQWWVALLSTVARLRCRLGGWRGSAYTWIWDRDNVVFDREECRRLLDEHLLPAFEKAVRKVPRPYGVNRFLALIVINTPEGQPIRRLELEFSPAQLALAKQKITDFLLAQTPMNLHRGSQIGCVVSNVAVLALLGPVYEPAAVLLTIGEPESGGAREQGSGGARERGSGGAREQGRGGDKGNGREN